MSLSGHRPERSEHHFFGKLEDALVAKNLIQETFQVRTNGLPGTIGAPQSQNLSVLHGKIEEATAEERSHTACLGLK